MSITDADRAGALRIAKARTLRQYRGTGIYPVTVGGIVIGQVEKRVNEWYAVEESGFEVPGGYINRYNAVIGLAESEFAAQAYRESARTGAQGTAEERRVREEDAARLAQLDAEELPPAQEWAVEELLTIAPNELRKDDVIVKIDGYTVEEPVTVLADAGPVYGDAGPWGAHLSTSTRATAHYLYVDQVTQVEVRRPVVEQPARSIDNNFVLRDDPAVWGPEQQAMVMKVGDDGTNCVLCGRKTGGSANTQFVLVSHVGTLLPPAEMPQAGALLDDGQAYSEYEHTMGCFAIGSECAKKVPAKYRMADPSC